MATIKEVKTQIQNANALGIANLTEKGVDVSADATTYDIMRVIAEISGGGGVTYTNIVYNEDNTITLTDKDGVIHTMECEYADGKLTSVKYDGKAVELTYNGDVLVKIGKTAVDVENAPVNSATLDHTVTFTVDGEPYEVVSVKDGNVVNEPTEPTKEGYVFYNWQNEGNDITFPLTPTEDLTITSLFQEGYADLLYDHFGIDKGVCPYVAIVHYTVSSTHETYVYFGKSYRDDVNGVYITNTYKGTGNMPGVSHSELTPESIVDNVIAQNAILFGKDNGNFNLDVNSSYYVYTNFPLKNIQHANYYRI